MLRHLTGELFVNKKEIHYNLYSKFVSDDEALFQNRVRLSVTLIYLAIHRSRIFTETVFFLIFFALSVKCYQQILDIFSSITVP